MDHFIPANLDRHQEMVRRLTREKMDGFIDGGRVDLVEELLYEVPLNVALHFLGVPEDEIAVLRNFSVAHSVNTWGRPTDDQQVAIAHDVGRFWQYAGKIIEKMKAEPEGTGWMHETIRKNIEMPEVVTDSYVHSMMMAIIVAAHETTSLASTNMFKTLLSHREAWEDICADPRPDPQRGRGMPALCGLHRCLAAAGPPPHAPWRCGSARGRQAADRAGLGNQDERHFEDGDRFDIYRDNAVDHLTFGYGSHQCMGKNIGRMEMRIFLEEFTRRLPQLRLAEQDSPICPTLVPGTGSPVGGMGPGVEPGAHHPGLGPGSPALPGRRAVAPRHRPQGARHRGAAGGRGHSWPDAGGCQGPTAATLERGRACGADRRSV